MVAPGSQALDLDSASDPPSTACFSNLSDLTETNAGHAAPAVRTRAEEPAWEREGVHLGAGPLPLLCPLGARTAPHSDDRAASEQEDTACKRDPA